MPAEPIHSASDSGPTTFGEALRTWRQQRKLTITQLAAVAECAKSYLSMIENGLKTTPPSDELVGRLEYALRLPPGELLQLAHWHTTPPTIRRQMEALEGARRAAVAQLKELLAAANQDARRAEGGAGPAAGGPALDALWRSGKLHQLIDQLGGNEPAPEQRDPRTVSRHSRPMRLAGGGLVDAPRFAAPRPGDAPALRPLSSLMPVEIPLINSVAAGYPTDFTDLGYPARVADSYVRSPDISDPDAFACRVVGDSMEPEYREGDIVIFSPARPIATGMDCFIRLEPDHESTFKRVWFEKRTPGADVAPDDEPTDVISKWAARYERKHAALKPEEVTHLRLEPLNNKYPARTVAREQIAGMYAAVSVTRALG